MHTLFEGVAIHHLQALLKHVIDVKKYFTLAQLNSRLRTHEYSHLEVKPSPITKGNNSYHIKQSGTIITDMYVYIYNLHNKCTIIAIQF